MIRPKTSPCDNDAEKQGRDQLDLVTEAVDVEDEAGEDGAVVGLSEDGDEDEGGHDTAGQVAGGNHDEERIGDVAPLFASFLPVEEDQDGGQATKEAEDNTEWGDNIGQQRYFSRYCFQHCQQWCQYCFKHCAALFACPPLLLCKSLLNLLFDNVPSDPLSLW